MTSLGSTEEAIVLLSLGIIVIALRLFSRVRTVGWCRLQVDDYLMVVAALAYAFETIMAYVAGHTYEGLANNNLTDARREALQRATDKSRGSEYYTRLHGSQAQMVSWGLYGFLLWTLKACMCAFYLRLADGLDHYHARVRLGFVLVATTWVVVICTLLLGCGLPFRRNWQIYPNPGELCQPAISRLNLFVLLILNIVTDFYIMYIPAPMLWRAKVTPLQKVCMFALFSGGLFVMTAGLLRCALILQDPINGGSVAGSWGVRETFVAVITTNMPVVGPYVMRSMIRPLGARLPTLLRRRIGLVSSDTDPQGPRLGPQNQSFKLRHQSWLQRSRHGPRELNPIPISTWNESEEGIVGLALSHGSGRGGTQAGEDEVLQDGNVISKRVDVSVSTTGSASALTNDAGLQQAKLGIQSIV